MQGFRVSFLNYFCEGNSEFSYFLNEFALFQALLLPLWHFVTATLSVPLPGPAGAFRQKPTVTAESLYSRDLQPLLIS